MFVEQTHELPPESESSDKPMRYTDTRIDEQERGISLKMMPMSLVMESSASKSYLFNIMDTPGKACLCARDSRAYLPPRLVICLYLQLIWNIFAVLLSGVRTRCAFKLFQHSLCFGTAALKTLHQSKCTQFLI